MEEYVIVYTHQKERIKYGIYQRQKRGAYLFSGFRTS